MVQEAAAKTRDSAMSGPFGLNSGSADPPSPESAKAALQQAFNDWSAKLTDHSFQFSLAIIGANWTVYRNGSAILNNCWAEASISVVLVSLAANLIGAFALSSLHLKRFDYAEADRVRWQKEFENTKGTNNPWPFAQVIETWGRMMRLLKLVLPLLGAIFFFWSLTE